MATAFRTFRLLIGLLLLTGSYSTSALSVTQRQSFPITLWLEETTTRDDYDDDDDDDDDVVADRTAIYDEGWGNGWTPIKVGARERANPTEVDGKDFRFVYLEPDAKAEKRGTGSVRKRKGFMGLDNVDYVASTLDLHRTMVGGRNNNNNHAHSSNSRPSSGTPDEPRNPLATPTRHRTNHKPSMTSRFPLSSNASPSDMRRMMKTLLDAGRRR